MNAGQQLRIPPPASTLYADLLAAPVKRRAKDFFVYSTSFLPIGASATLASSFNVESDSDFLIVAAVATVQNNATPGTFIAAGARAFTVELIDTGSSRIFQNEAQAFDNLFGTATLPAYWPYPKWVNRNTTITVRLVNQTATAFQVRCAFLGFKLFDFDEKTGNGR